MRRSERRSGHEAGGTGLRHGHGADGSARVRSGEPGDWNRLRKIKMLRPRLHFVPTPLMSHYKERNQAPFVAQPGETFLD